jgi:hypothetical protein
MTDDLKERVDFDARSQANQFLHWKGYVQDLRGEIEVEAHAKLSWETDERAGRYGELRELSPVRDVGR